MDRKLIIPLAALTLLGLFLLGNGITGMVVSESCCVGTGCSQENLCDVARPNLELPTGQEPLNVYLGLGAVIVSVALFVFLNRSP